jgi:HSF-type DNA-binding
MSLMCYADKQDENFCVAWLEDGKTFIIRNPDTFTRQVVPQFFKPTKFSSFTRKLYRWGFRQVNRGIGPDDPIIFGNEYFLRDNAELMAKMKSVTAAITRKQEQVQLHIGMTGGYPMKRSMDDHIDEGNHKRMLLDHLLHHKATNYMTQNPNIYGNMGPNEGLSLNNALCPPPMGYTGGSNHSHNMMYMNGNNKHYDMMSQPSHNVGGMMNQYVPQGMSGGSQQYPNPASTAEIVNAAIAALRYAN